MGRFLSSLTFVTLLWLAPAVVACPNCKEAVASTGDPTGDDDPFREAKAYNWSIYLMLAVPYTLLGMGGLVGYRYYRHSRPPQSPGA